MRTSGFALSWNGSTSSTSATARTSATTAWARLAVEEGKLAASSLALLEDRIEMRNGRPQIYGSQVRMANGKSTLWAIRDEETVNERRASVGLGLLEEYAARFGINWSPAKKQDRVLLLGPVEE
ncbi:MAG: hypothetical protein IPG69_10680 [Flavobacteriales bacterium]|nr:hypothetical protein [Flavobacteriales bacterium]